MARKLRNQYMLGTLSTTVRNWGNILTVALSSLGQQVLHTSVPFSSLPWTVSILALLCWQHTCYSLACEQSEQARPRTSSSVTQHLVIAIWVRSSVSVLTLTAEIVYFSSAIWVLLGAGVRGKCRIRHHFNSSVLSTLKRLLLSFEMWVLTWRKWGVSPCSISNVESGLYPSWTTKSCINGTETLWGKIPNLFNVPRHLSLH